MSYNDIPVKCCRCKNQHNESERVRKPDSKMSWLTNMVCPRCGCRSYFDMSPVVAYCWASGLIEIGDAVPHGAIKIAHGPKVEVKFAIEVLARHGRGVGEGKFLVPGVPEATSQLEAGVALSEFLKFAAKNRAAKKNGVVFSSEEVQ